MKRSLFIFVFIFMVAIISATSSYALEIKTGDGPNEGIVDELGVPLKGNLSSGYLVQVIKLPNGTATPQAPDNNGNPTNGETLAGTTSIEYGFSFDTDTGQFSSSLFTIITGGYYYVRAWNNYTVGTATYYGNSGIYGPVIGLSTEEWNINGTANVPAFATNISFDNTPPGPPTNLVATTEISGDIIVSWTKSISADAAGTRLVYKTGNYPTGVNDGTATNVLISASSQAVRVSGLSSGTPYYFRAYTYDTGMNYSISAEVFQTSTDSILPTIISTDPYNAQQNVGFQSQIKINFSEPMDTVSCEAAFKIFPAAAGGFTWQSNQLKFSPTALAQGQVYICTIETRARDLAKNNLLSPTTFTFRTANGLPPTMSNVKIDGWKQFPGDIISLQPKIEATFNHPTLTPSGIVSVEIIANSTRYMYSGATLADVYNSTTGDFGQPPKTARFPIKLPEGTYTLTIRAYDIYGNSTEEVFPGLIVMAGAGKIIGPVIYYPNPFNSGDGTTFAYKLSVDANIEFFIYNIAGNVVYRKMIPASAPGAQAGYNEYFWNGLTNAGQGLGSGMYLVRIISDNIEIADFKVVLLNNK